MNEQIIEEIKQALREMMQFLIDRGEPLTDELKASIAQAMEHAANRISELRAQDQTEPQATDQAPILPQQDATPQRSPSVPTGGPVPPLEPAPHESSNINAFRFDPKSGQLFVKFQDKFPGTNGPVYAYEGVPNYIFDIFRRGAVAPKTSGKNNWHTWKEGVTPSHGAAMYALIKAGNFPYQRLS